MGLLMEDPTLKAKLDDNQKDLMDAAVIANSTEYGLTSAIHTRSIDRAMWFAKHVKTGVVNVNSAAATVMKDVTKHF